TISLTFMLPLGWSELNSAIGLIIGGVIAAPFGSILVKRLPVRPLMVAVSMIRPIAELSSDQPSVSMKVREIVSVTANSVK
ncbi:hypothetical protein ACC694_38185, partial [Rhizobium ruizarguesonis]